MKNRSLIIISIIILGIIALWIGGVIPKQIGKIYGTKYMKDNFPEMQFEYVNIEWSSSFGGYSIIFKDENDEIYGFIMNNKYFPISLGQGLFGFEEKYNKKYSN